MSTLDDFKENDLIQSVYDEAKNRMKSIMWGTFVISWCLWNWESIYTTIFVDQAIIFEQTKLFKIEYILQHYYSWKTIGSTLWNCCKLGFGPALSTYIIVYQISKLDLIFFKQNYKNKIAQKNAALDIDSNLLTKEGKIIDDEKIILEKKKKNISIQKKIEKDLTDEEKWNKEFLIVRTKKSFSEAIRILRQCIYEHRGHVSGIGITSFSMSANILSYLHVNGLIEFQIGSNNTIIELTQKGKFFLNKYIDLIS